MYTEDPMTHAEEVEHTYLIRPVDDWTEKLNLVLDEVRARYGGIDLEGTQTQPCLSPPVTMTYGDCVVLMLRAKLPGAVTEESVLGHFKQSLSEHGMLITDDIDSDGNVRVIGLPDLSSGQSGIKNGCTDERFEKLRERFWALPRPTHAISFAGRPEQLEGVAKMLHSISQEPNKPVALSSLATATDLLRVVGGLVGECEHVSLLRAMIAILSAEAQGLPPPTDKELGLTDSQCFIATAACGEASEEVVTLRSYRDTHLRNHAAGRAFIVGYNMISPSMARLIAKSPRLRRAVRRWLVSPLASTVARRSMHREPAGSGG